MPRLVRVLMMAALAASGAGCAGAKVLRTPRYILTYPEFWELKSEGQKDGEASVFTIGQYGSAVIDEGSGALTPREASYDTVTADVEVRLFSWAEPDNVKNPSDAVMELLARDKDLKLSTHHLVLDSPPECGRFRRKYKSLGVVRDPVDLVSRPGFRAIVIGSNQGGVLLGVVTRVEFQQDMGRYCHDLSNMQVQLQNVLDGLVVVPVAGGKAAPAAAPAAEPAVPPPAAPAPAS